MDNLAGGVCKRGRKLRRDKVRLLDTSRELCNLAKSDARARRRCRPWAPCYSVLAVGRALRVRIKDANWDPHFLIDDANRLG